VFSIQTNPATLEAAEAKRPRRDQRTLSEPQRQTCLWYQVTAVTLWCDRKGWKLLRRGFRFFLDLLPHRAGHGPVVPAERSRAAALFFREKNLFATINRPRKCPRPYPSFFLPSRIPRQLSPPDFFPPLATGKLRGDELIQAPLKTSDNDDAIFFLSPRKRRTENFLASLATSRERSPRRRRSQAFFTCESSRPAKR